MTKLSRKQCLNKMTSQVVFFTSTPHHVQNECDFAQPTVYHHERDWPSRYSAGGQFKRRAVGMSGG